MTQIKSTDLLEQINQKNKLSSNKSVFKIRVKHPLDVTKLEIFYSVKLEKFNSYIEFIGFLVKEKNENIESVQDLTQKARDKGWEEMILTIPWQNIVDIQIVKQKGKNDNGE